MPHRTIEFAEHDLTEAARQSIARHRMQIGDRSQPHALQRIPMLTSRAEQPHRRSIQRTAGGGDIGAMQVRMHACKQSCTQRRGCTHDVHAMPERRHRRPKALEQALQATEVAQAGLHFEQHRVSRAMRQITHGRGLARRLDHHMRRERQRSMRDSCQSLSITRGICLAEDELRRQGQCRRALEARFDAESPRRLIGAGDGVSIHQCSGQ